MDFSGCTQVEDDTLVLISQHLQKTIEVLYLRGCTQISDDGICAIAEKCQELRVLEVNFVPMTDKSGVAIGENLLNLEALYMRDNYLITNETVRAISEGCTKLTQLTLSGCIRVRIEEVSFTMKLNKLVMLNFWGCHCLQDSFATMLGSLEHLRSLIVAECHNLGDAFVKDLCEVRQAKIYKVSTCLLTPLSTHCAILPSPLRSSPNRRSTRPISTTLI